MAAPMFETVGRALPRNFTHLHTLCKHNHLKHVRKISITTSMHGRKDVDKHQKSDFRLLKIRPTEEDFMDIRDRIKKEKEERKQVVVARRPRSQGMPTDQDWSNVWPTAKSFNWSVVPLPIRQGTINRMSECEGDGLPPDKQANLELIKIPNFLHLTPRHIKNHCNVLKSFCTKWPVEMKSEEDVSYHFPMEVITSDYCFSGPSVRDSRARVVTVKFKLSELELDGHAKDKFLRLVGSRYDPKTGVVTLTSDRCPIKKQNFDYLQYLMTALYFESWKKEAWEEEMTEEDASVYQWDMDERKGKILSLLQTCQTSDQTSETAVSERLAYLPEELSESTIESLEPVKQYGDAVEELYNSGENYTTITNYKKAVMQMLNLKTKTSAHAQN